MSTYSLDIVHKSVMVNEVVEYLKPQDNHIYVDCTFGAGGYSRAILNAANCKIIAIDKDPEVSSFANKLREEVGESRFAFFNQSFSEIIEVLRKLKIEKVDGMVLDLGVSSMQLDTDYRGFSFMHDGQIDMRMARNGISALDVINKMPEKELADIIYQYGDERNSRKIAKAIIEKRKIAPITMTSELRQIIHSVSRKIGKIDSATKTFQALRIYVNQELEELTKLLEIIKDIIKSGGRIVVVSFHSLEDRIVKNFLRNNKPIFEIMTKKVIQPSYEEVKKNPRARSAKLRAASIKW